MEFGQKDLIYDESEGGQLTIGELYDFLGSVLKLDPELKNGTVFADTPQLYMPVDRIRISIDKIKMHGAKAEALLQLENSESETSFN
jgi:hypothetical protein